MSFDEMELRDRLRWISSDVLNLEYKLNNDGFIEPHLINNIIQMLYTAQELNNKLKEQNGLED